MRWSCAILAIAAACGRAMTVEECYQGMEVLAARWRVCSGTAPAFAAKQWTCMHRSAASAAAGTRTVLAGENTIFDRAAAADCLNELASLYDPSTCWGAHASGAELPEPSLSGPSQAQGVRLFPACTRVFWGRIAEGRPCNDWRECAPGICGSDNLCHDPGLG